MPLMIDSMRAFNSRAVHTEGWPLAASRPCEFMRPGASRPGTGARVRVGSDSVTPLNRSPGEVPARRPRAGTGLSRPATCTEPRRPGPGPAWQLAMKPAGNGARAWLRVTVPRPAPARAALRLEAPHLSEPEARPTESLADGRRPGCSHGVAHSVSVRPRQRRRRRMTRTPSHLESLRVTGVSELH